MLCFCVLHVLGHFVHWNCCIQAMCSTVACCNSILLCNSVRADRSRMAAAAAGVIQWSFISEIRNFIVMAASVANGALAADFFHFGTH